MSICYEKMIDVITKEEYKSGKIVDVCNVIAEETMQRLDNIIALQTVSMIEEVSDAISLIICSEQLFLSDHHEEYLCLQRWLEANKVPVMILVKNPIDKSTIYELLSGQYSNYLNVEGYTPVGIKQLMAENSYKCVSEDYIQSETEQDIKSENIFVEKGSWINQYLTWIQQYVHANLDVNYFVQVYEYSEMEKVEEKSAPFLSVITRTQGKRIEALRETLLSLAGQECDDFEVLVMAHNIEKQCEENVLEVIDEMPDYLKEKIRYIPVFGGNRSTPINKGFENAHGSYAVLLDDDDLAFDNWVSSFKEKAMEHPGSIIHSYVISQSWSMTKDATGQDVLRAEDSPNNEYCKDFHFISEVYGNSCPVLGLAFPLFPFKKMGFVFDETLDTTEDWDFLMSISNICGVVDVKEPTSMYRLWNNAENSHSLHDVEIWDANRKKIQNRLRERPLNLPKEYVDELIYIAEKEPYLFGERDATSAQITPLYYDIGKGYNEKDVKRIGSRESLPTVFYQYINMENVGNIHSLRWDPYNFGNVCVEDVTFIITLANGKRIVRTADTVGSNGFKVGKKIIFFHPDPQIYVKFLRPVNISRVFISAKISKDIEENMHWYLSKRYNSNLVQKAKTGIKVLAKTILRR